MSLLRRFSDSLIARLVVAGIVLVVAGAVGRYHLLAHFLREDLEVVVSAQQQSLASYVAGDVDYKIRERLGFLERMSITLPVALLSRPEDLRVWLAERHQLLPLFSHGVMVINRQGIVIADFPAYPGRVGMDLSDRPNFRAALAGKSGVGRPVVGPATGEPVVPMGVPVRDRDGQVVAVLVGVTAHSSPGFLDSLQNNRIGETGGFLLVSPRDNLFVSSSDSSLILKPTPSPGVNPLHDRAMAGYRGTGITTNAKGVEEISAIASVPSADWFVVARLPTAEAFATVDRAQSMVLRYGVFSVLLVIAYVALASWWALRPLFNAARRADRMTLGEAPLEPLPVERDDEVGHLTASFNRLLEKVRTGQDELARLAHHDTLTGLPNRRMLADRMQQALARCRRNGHRVVLFFMDLDGFKLINDDLGHDVGDEALRRLAARLSQQIREEDTLARVGGDEFVLLVTDVAGEYDEIATLAESIAAKCTAAVALPLVLQGQERGVGVSIGGVIGTGDSSEEDLINGADRAMYRAKEAGRNSYVLSDELSGSLPN